MTLRGATREAPADEVADTIYMFELQEKYFDQSILINEMY